LLLLAVVVVEEQLIVLVILLQAVAVLVDIDHLLLENLQVVALLLKHL
jgi:hypothetical protein